LSIVLKLYSTLLLCLYFLYTIKHIEVDVIALSHLITDMVLFVLSSQLNVMLSLISQSFRNIFSSDLKHRAIEFYVIFFHLSRWRLLLLILSIFNAQFLIKIIERVRRRRQQQQKQINDWLLCFPPKNPIHIHIHNRDSLWSGSQFSFYDTFIDLISYIYKTFISNSASKNSNFRNCFHWLMTTNSYIERTNMLKSQKGEQTSCY
jgi:hypothetical protein